MARPLDILDFNAMACVLAEIQNARERYPSTAMLALALTEHVGKLAQAMLDGKTQLEVRSEAREVAAIALRIYVEGDAAVDDYRAAKAVQS